mgnify:CR=1 FL=1
MDIEESGKQIGEKLFLLLDEEQKNALMQYILEQEVCHGSALISCHTSSIIEKNPLTEIQEGELYLCLEHRTVRVRERIINRQVKSLIYWHYSLPIPNVFLLTN